MKHRRIPPEASDSVFGERTGDRCALFLLKNIFLPDEGLVEMEEMGRGARDRGILFPKNGRLKKKCPIFAAGNRFNANYDGFSNILF